MKTQIKPSFQSIIQRLNEFWSARGCVLWYPHHEAVGAGTNNPATILRILGPEPLHVAYVEPSFRPDDGRYALNPNRVQMHHQYQVIIKPPPHNIQQLYLDSLAVIGIDYREHDIRFVEDNWESPVLGAWGLGWEVWCDGMEVTQYTYFQQAGTLPLNPPACELTYGLERLAMYVQGVSSIWDIQWNETTTYGELLREQEIRYCSYAFEHADVSRLRESFELFEKEALLALEKELPIVAYDYVCRLSHTFNLLDTRGAVALSERVAFFARIRNLTRKCAEGYIAERKQLGFPALQRKNPLLAALVPEKTVDEPTNSRPSSTKEDFILEIGVEELASFVIDPLQKQLQTSFLELLRNHRFAFDDLSVYSTPRRLVVAVSGLARQQREETQTIKGPAKTIIARNPKALEGFCRKAGISAEQVRYELDNGAEIAVAEVTLPTQSIQEVAPLLMRELMKGLGVGRSMRWLPYSDDHNQTSGEDGVSLEKVEFNRPIRWILALFGTEVLPLQYAGLKASRTSYGPRWSNSEPINIASAQQYFQAMQESKVLLDSKARRAAIEQQLIQCAHSVGGIISDYESLLDEVTHLVETPTAFVAEFSREFDDIPGSVKRAIIAKHIRCFPIYASDGAFLPFCVGVKNGTNDHLEIVRRGFERVIVARLSDAKFFISRDADRSLEDMLPGLANLTFHEQLGSMREKASRVERLAGLISTTLKFSPVEHTATTRAAFLAKADLASQMVTEMTSLQGEMGSLYAEAHGEDKAVCIALREQYLPRYANDIIPSSKPGLGLALADKIDTLTAFLSIGLEPTGSADPFALRREALGIISLLLGSKTDMDLSPCITSVIDMIGKGSPDDVCHRTLGFLEKRLEVVLREQEGLEHDVVRCVLAVLNNNPYGALSVARDLTLLLEEPAFREFLPAYTRCVRIVRKADGEMSHTPSTELMNEPAERELWDVVQKVESSLKADESLESRFRKLVVLQNPINAYFDSVMVMAEEPKIRSNRLGLVARVAALLESYGDLTILEA